MREGENERKSERERVRQRDSKWEGQRVREITSERDTQRVRVSHLLRERTYEERVSKRDSD